MLSHLVSKLMRHFAQWLTTIHWNILQTFCRPTEMDAKRGLQCGRIPCILFE
jgi:hypothetical protein